MLSLIRRKLERSLPPDCMTETTVRDRVIRAVQEMPTDTTYEDVLERVYMIQKIERGRQQIADGQGIPHPEARRQMKRWHE